MDPMIAAKYLPDRIVLNNDTMYRTRTIGVLFAGIVAGILGLTNIYGLVFFALASVASSFAILIFSCGNQREQFFVTNGKELFSLSTLSTGMLTYVLAWMVAYDAIYVF